MFSIYSRVSAKVNKAGILMLLLLVPSAFLRAQWYVTYEKGREAVKNGHWEQGVTYLTEVLNDEPDSKANKKTYGLTFSDYFPYLYRGIAYYKLGDLANARADLEKAKSEGAIDDWRSDKEAPSLLKEYISLLQKPAPQTAEQRPPQNTPQNPPPAVPQTDPKYTEGVRLFNQREFRKALDQFTAVPESSPQHALALKYIDRAQAELKKLETAADQREKRDRIEKGFASGVEYFKRDDLDRAEAEFKNVLGLESTHRGAGEYLKRIEARRQKLAAAVHQKELPPPTPQEPPPSGKNRGTDTTGLALFRDAVALFNDGKIGQSKAKFQSLQNIAPSYPELANYMALIVSIENKVHMGIAAFFEGEYSVAIDQLRSSSKNGNDNPHVYAFLACSCAAEYLLAGAENGSLRKEAVDAFGKLKGIDPRYELDRKLISPGIIALLTGE
jgi:tetratricopeptide (TPR) repeat protein